MTSALPSAGEPGGAPIAADRVWLKVTHDTCYNYDASVELAHHMAHLSPRDTPAQQVRGWRLSIDPPPDEWLQGRPVDDGGVPMGQSSLDCWGNRRVAFSHARVHERLQVRSSFEAGILPAAPPDPARSPPWEEVAQQLRYHAGSVRSEAVEFTIPSAYAPRDPSLAALGREAFSLGVSVAGGALTLMQLIHERFTYEPHATDVATRAPEALAEMRGVCQDFAHVMIGACRSLGLSARYVSGYLLTQPPPGQARLVGADASHAWVQVWCPLQGWIALDPTNAVPAGTGHVTLAWGRDYADVAPLRGVIRGGGRALPRVGVTVEPLSSWAPSPSGAAPATEG
ncbi:transglutaminase family protein [Ideonella sp. DXS29W]|uniref:Transglutaminase family protein n=1 Tax=Ideonella lacteola TaxID=2984193 RepID=A0ABU9BMZ1_9BURK